MLTLSRRRGESIKIGAALVTIRRAGPVRVVVTIDAPRDVIVRRGELPDQDGDQDGDQDADQALAIARDDPQGVHR